MTTKAKIAVALLALGAVGLMLGALALPWWTGQLGEGSFEINLRHMTMCLRGVCGEPKPLGIADASAAPWAKIGLATLASSIVAAALAILVAVKLATASRLGVIAWVASVVAVFAGLLGGIFIWAHPSFGDWTPGFGMAACLVGAFVTAVAAVLARSSGVGKTAGA